MCEIKPGTLAGTSERILVTGEIYRVPRDEEQRLGPPFALKPARAGNILRLECRHPGTTWEEIPWPRGGQFLSLPPLTELRLKELDSHGPARPRFGLSAVKKLLRLN